MWQCNCVVKLSNCCLIVQYQEELGAIETLLLLLVLLTPGIASGASHCMADCSGSVQRGPSIYQQICCQVENLGKTVRLKEIGRVKIIICPSKLLQSCPGTVKIVTCTT